MRICLYTDTALPKLGGQELVVDALARQFQGLGHTVTVLAPHPRLPLRAEDRALPYPVARHPRFYSTRYFVNWYGWWLYRLQRRSPFDVLHCHGVYPPAYLAALNRQRLGTPVVLTSHGGDVREGSVRISKPIAQCRAGRAIRAADALVAISRFTADGFRRFGADLARIVTIPNGVDVDAFRRPAGRPADLDPDIVPGRYALFLGRLKHRKGADLLLPALKTVPPADGVQLVVAGDGEELPRLRQLTDQLGLTGRVRFVGAVGGDNKAYLLQNALCTVMPSRVWEAFPLVVLESYAAGTPVLASRVPGLEDLVETGRTGWLVSPENATALATALTDALGDPGRCAELGRQAELVSRGYSWRSVACRHIQLYAGLLEAAQDRQAA